ncbi:hypothetical protein ANO11243_061590 [Dothideomycetidae sp. 11243]|nr:hypothetical protein ANO11243_061590 [fungal sp. No.11243]
MSLSTGLLILVSVITVAYYVLGRLFAHDPREPPLAPQSIPFIGHVIGLSRSSFNYHVQLSKRVSSPIFTMVLPGQKMYVVTKPDLIQQVQKLYKALSFAPIEAKFSTRIAGSSDKTKAILKQSLKDHDNNVGLSADTQTAMRESTRPGAALDEMNRVMISEMARLLNDLQPARGATRTFKMHAWLREAMTLATTRSAYGPKNPYDDKEIADAFWVFEGGMMSILLGILPSITARKPTAARDKLAGAFEDYYRSGGVKTGSVLARRRYEVKIKNGLDIAEAARFEAVNGLAILVNTVPAAFWSLLMFHSDSTLLVDIRKEVDACTVSEDVSGTTTKTLDLNSLKEECPLLLSAYQEVLRYRAMGASIREVMEDTQLDNFLLKKGAMLQMPTRVLHEDKDIWGSTDFQPRRFLPENGKRQPRDDTFRAFGGGKTLCPGRHFATNEIMAFTALFIARFDMKPVKGSWELPTVANTNAASAIMEPDYDVDAEITTRNGFEDVKWAIRLNASDRVYGMVTED